MSERDELVALYKDALKAWQAEAGDVAAAEHAAAVLNRLGAVDPEAAESDEVRKATAWAMAMTTGEGVVARAAAEAIEDVLDPRRHLSQRRQLESLAELSQALRRTHEQQQLATMRFATLMGHDYADIMGEAMRDNPDVTDSMMPPDPDDA